MRGPSLALGEDEGTAGIGPRPTAPSGPDAMPRPSRRAQVWPVRYAGMWLPSGCRCAAGRGTRASWRCARRSAGPPSAGSGRTRRDGDGIRRSGRCSRRR
jgi:hypothetical protein